MHELQRELQRFKRDTQYYEAHRKELLTQYPEQWVAVFNQQVVGAAPDFDQLLTVLEQSGIPAEWALIEHVTRKEELLNLSLFVARKNWLKSGNSPPCFCANLVNIEEPQRGLLWHIYVNCDQLQTLIN